MRKAYALLINSLFQLSRYEEAQQACRKAREFYDQDPELLFREGMLLHQLRRYDESVTSYKSALAPSEKRHFSSIDIGIVGYKARHNLGVVYQEMGRPKLAELEWRKSLEEVPDGNPTGNSQSTQQSWLTVSVAAGTSTTSTCCWTSDTTSSRPFKYSSNGFGATANIAPPQKPKPQQSSQSRQFERPPSRTNRLTRWGQCRMLR